MQIIVFPIVLLTVGIAICFAASSTYDGKPGCKTLGEVGKAYRNFWDPMRYWRCIGLNMEPLQENCPNGTGFQQSLNRCVPWTAWRWETPVYPPSCPNGVMCLPNDLPPEDLVAVAHSPVSSLLGQPQPLQPVQPAQPVQPLQPLQPVQPVQTISPLPPIPSDYYAPAVESVHPITSAQIPIQYSGPSGKI